MGQGSSAVVDNRRQVRGGIFIQLQKTAFVSNEAIQEEPFQGHNLQVCLEGFEETHFTYTISTGSGKNRRTKTVYAKGFNPFLNFSIPVYDFAMGSNNMAHVINPCQVVIPFQLVVADKLPSSMNYFFNQHTRCSLKYRLTASIIPTEVNVKPVSGSQEIFIGQQIATLPQPHITNSIQEPVIYCCCKNGQIKYNATINGQSFSPNENVEIDMDVDCTQYGKTVTDLIVNLKGELQMKANNTTRLKIINTFNKQVNVPVQGNKCQQKVQIPVPPDISLSCSGSLITLTYYVQITPKIDSCCCITANIPHSVKVIINPTSNQIQHLQNLPQQMAISAPQNWNPTQLQAVQFDQQQAAMMQQQQQLFIQQEQQLYYQQMGIQPMQPAGQPMMANQNQSFL